MPGETRVPKLRGVRAAEWSALALLVVYLALWMQLGARVVRHPGAVLAGGYLLFLGVPVLIFVCLVCAVVYRQEGWRGSRRLVFATVVAAALLFTGTAARLGQWLDAALF